ncbi:hypothetical protein INT47_008056 [Mucor saturninus]|uniref:Phospholipid/glycerol acyltransferase domain-containing protein n=1 Tax=Mucor saturninus TaxID=64648 RepID=A0A8H7R798_9FUNG|nr:hypothetical protein INT47_008056 [Mucor saturninus]
MATVISSTSLPIPPPASATWWSPKTILQILFVNFGLFFQSTCVVFTQLFSLFIYPFSFKKYRQFISYTMRMWSQSLVALVQWFAPANIVMTFDESCGSLDEIIKDGDITNLTFPKRIIVTANHQIYADWIYIWCIAHLAGAHGVVKIILKHSLKNLPVYGLKLALDHDTIVGNLERSKKSDQPMWLVLFPEGTVVSPCTRKRSKEFAEARYSGVGANDIPEQVYTIQSIFFFKHFPKQVHVHVRRFKIATIPRGNGEEFNQWVHQRWVEKDELMGHFYKYGVFPDIQDRTIDVPIKLRNNSVMDLAQIWIFLVPYILLLKQLLNFDFHVQNAAA